MNRWTNLIAAVLNIAAVVSSMFMGTSPTLTYLFFGAVEIGCLSLIIGYAWK